MYHHHDNSRFRYLLLLAFVALPSLLPPAASRSLPTSPTTTTTTSPHGTLSICTSGNVTTVTISHPPINLYDIYLASDLYGFLNSLNPMNRTTPPPKVVIFRSADPEFFIAHVDVNAFVEPLTPEKLTLLGYYSPTLRLMQSLTNTAFIAEVDGRATAGGNEILMWTDMRFAGPNAHLGSLEMSLGVTHGAGGMQFLARLINKARALQFLLSGDSIGCKKGMELGWFNECYHSRKEMEETVGDLAKRIALRPQGGLNATKAGLQDWNPPLAVVDADMETYKGLNQSPEAQALFKKFLVLGKNQTRSPFELGLDATLAQLYEE